VNFPPHFLLDSPLSPKTRFLRRLLLATGVPRGGVRGFKPPLDLQNLFWIMCLQNILCNSALILIKSYIFYRKTLKIVHQFHILLQPLPGLCHWTPLEQSAERDATGPHWGTSVPQAFWSGPTTWTPSIVKSCVRLYASASFANKSTLRRLPIRRAHMLPKYSTAGHVFSRHDSAPHVSAPGTRSGGAAEADVEFCCNS